MLFSLVVAAAAPANAYFVIELRDGGTFRADFVREDGGKVYASRGPGEVKIDKGRIGSILEVKPGVKLAPESQTVIPPQSSTAPASAVGLTSDELKERNDKKVREIILGHRDLLFARLRGDSETDLLKRRIEIKGLEMERERILEQLPSWEREQR